MEHEQMICIGILIFIICCALYIYFSEKEQDVKEKKKIQKHNKIKEGFEASSRFKGYRKNKVFKLGDKGLGYYLDK